MTLRCPWFWFALLAGSVAAACAEPDRPANCGHENVEVVYTQKADLAAACNVLAGTLGYFQRMGFEVEPRFSLTFVDPGQGKSVEGVISYGYVDLRSSIIVVYSSSYREPWGLLWSRKVASSFLQHELVHIAVWQILGPEAERLPREWHEFIAYAVQLDLMDPEILKDVLAHFSDVHAFDELSEVNEFTYGMNPEVFAVAAYLTYRKRGAQNFVRRLLRAEIVPPQMVFPFPVLPEEDLKR